MATRLSRYCLLLLAIALLSTNFNEAVVLDGVVHAPENVRLASVRLDRAFGATRSDQASRSVVTRIRAPQDHPHERRNNLRTRRGQHANKRSLQDEEEPDLSPTAAPTEEEEEEDLEKPSQPEDRDMDKPSLNHTSSDIPDRNHSKSHISVELSVAVVLREGENVTTNVNATTNNNVTYDSVLLEAVISAMDAVITNDTDYQVEHDHSNGTHVHVNNKTTTDESSQRSSWTYALKVENATLAESGQNYTDCLGSNNDTMTVMWLHVRVDYLILPRRPWNATHNESDSPYAPAVQNVFETDPPYEEAKQNDKDDDDEEDDEDDNGDDDDDEEDGVTDEEEEDEHEHLPSKTILGNVVNATIERMEDGSLLEWIQVHDEDVVGVAQVDEEESAQCNDVTLPIIPFVDPLDTDAWDALQVFGTILLTLTLLGTSSLCFMGRNRSKLAQEWTAGIGNESAVDDFLRLSRQVLPPECLNQRDKKGATIVIMPSHEPEDEQPHLEEQVGENDEELGHVATCR